MAGNALKKITTRAKQIVKKHPNKKWSVALKEAGREYRSGKISGTKTRSKKVGAKKKAPVRKKSSLGSVTTGGSLESQLKKQLKEQLGWLLVSREQAKTKTEKNKLARKAVEIRKKLRAFS